MTSPARVILHPGRAKPFYGRHPWVFAGAIASIAPTPKDGDEVDVYSHAGDFIARGLFNSQSNIRVRLYSWSSDTQLNEGFFCARIADAVRLRRDVLGLGGPGRACRLLFSEGDGLSGLVIDQYDQWLVAQFTSLGIAQRRESLVHSLRELLQPIGIYIRTERGIGALEGLELEDQLLWGTVPESPIVIEEGGVQFAANIRQGQKTGLYLDQRDNRQTVARLAAGRKVLDAFCYTGGFGLHAARAGADSVLGVDLSGPALQLAEQNARLNGLANLSFIRQDVFAHLRTLREAGQAFGMIILDPPKFARARNAIEEALRGYRRLQSLSMRLLEKGGILVTCCCSGLITAEMLVGLLAQIAVEENRRIQIIERRGQAADHPVSPNCPESNYLKCLICRVL